MKKKRKFRPENGEFCADEYDNIFIASNIYIIKTVNLNAMGVM